jgi:Raf kinase inhibitor-like YbhB/YbcL family protein
MHYRSIVQAVALAAMAASGAVVAALGQSAATAPSAATQPGETSMFHLESTAFANGQRIPKDYSGEGKDISPPLAWANMPHGTKELSLIVDDPDAPRPEPWVHWVIYRIPASATSLNEGIAQGKEVKHPAGALQGKNTGGKTGYSGPMPPPGHGVHRYFFRLYALDAHMPEEAGADKTHLLAAMKPHTLAVAELMGTYERK